MRLLRITFGVLWTVCCLDVRWARSDNTEPFLEQGWNVLDRQNYYHLSQGSQLVPYKWIQALEQEQKEAPFLADEIIKKYGYVKSPYDKNLPIGFTIDSTRQDQEWLGLTCAACHTQQIEYDKKTFIIDGGPASADLMGFLEFMSKSFDETLDKEAKFARFAKKVLGKEPLTPEAWELRQKVMARAIDLRGQAGREKDFRNYTELKSGPGRADAIGLLTNEILGAKMDLPENYRPPNAPTNYPSIWYAPRFTKLQWNGGLERSETRNVGEALGVFVSFSYPKGCLEDCINPKKLFQSSLNTKNLGEMWKLIGKLRPPEWPFVTGDLAIKPDLAKAGKLIYEAECKTCHQIIDPDSPSKELIKTEPHPVSKVRTDPLMAENFLSRSARFPLGEVVGKICEETMGKHLLPLMMKLVGSSAIDCESTEQSVKGKSQRPARDFVQIVGAGIIAQAGADDSDFALRILAELSERFPQEIGTRFMGKIKDQVDKVLKQGNEPSNSEIEPLPPKYKAGPLAGIWATAPYLHNGSVPNLEELLKPAGERVKTFCAGSREFDPINVGFQYQPDAVTGCSKFPGGFEFDTNKAGNRNTGHEYGLPLSPDKDEDSKKRKQLIEYLKTL